MEMTPTKDLDYYMRQEYKYLLWYDHEYSVWFIEIPAFRGCLTEGETVAEAFEMIKEAKESWIESMLDGGVIPDSDIE